MDILHNHFALKYVHFWIFSCRFLTPLHVAADKSHYDVMDVLLKHGAKVRYLHCNSSCVLIKMVNRFVYYYLTFVFHGLLLICQS